MSKARSTGNLNNSIVISDTGAITFVSGSTTLATINTTGQISGSTSVKSAATASYADSFTVASTLTAQTLVVQTITSSIVYSSGSNVFGNSQANTQVMTGSLLITGSFRLGSSNQQTTGTERLYVGQNSAIGIDDANSLSLFVTHTPVTGSPQIGFTYQFRQNDNSGANLYGDAIKVVKNAGANTTYTIFSTNSTIGAGTERMRIDASGNVGIGTSSPFGKFNVYAGSNLSFVVQDSGIADTIELTNYSSVGGIRAILINGSALSFGTGTAGGGSASEKMRITSNGSSSTLGSGGIVKILGSGTSNGFSELQFYTYNAPSNQPPVSIGVLKTDNSGFENGVFYIATKASSANSAPLERLRVTSGGGVQIGSTAGPGASDIGVFIGGTNSSFINLYSGYSGGAAGMNITNASNTSVIQFFGSTGNYSFAGSNVSDRRAKTNIQEITSGLPNILQLKPSTFSYNDHPNNTKGGFIAQEVLEVIPEFVTIPEDETEMMGVDYNGILALAVKAIQELKAENDTLKEILQRNNIQ
jgi:hypothetical protein